MSVFQCEFVIIMRFFMWYLPWHVCMCKWHTGSNSNSLCGL